MASSNHRQRQLAREKHERQQARRSQEEKKADRTKWIAIILIVAMVALTTGGYLLGKVFSLFD